MEEVVDGGAAVGVLVGGEVALGFVEQDVDFLLGRRGLPSRTTASRSTSTQCSGSRTGLPLTLTRPRTIHSRASVREQMPALERMRSRVLTTRCSGALGEALAGVFQRLRSFRWSKPAILQFRGRCTQSPNSAGEGGGDAEAVIRVLEGDAEEPADGTAIDAAISAAGLVQLVSGRGGRHLAAEEAADESGYIARLCGFRVGDGPGSGGMAEERGVGEGGEVVDMDSGDEVGAVAHEAEAAGGDGDVRARPGP